MKRKLRLQLKKQRKLEVRSRQKVKKFAKKINERREILVQDDGKRVLVTLDRSVIGRAPNQRATVIALGLGKVGSKNEHVLNGAIKGMIRTVIHLVSVKEIN